MTIIFVTILALILNVPVLAESETLHPFESWYSSHTGLVWLVSTIIIISFTGAQWFVIRVSKSMNKKNDEIIKNQKDNLDSQAKYLEEMRTINESVSKHFNKSTEALTKLNDLEERVSYIEEELGIEPKKRGKK